MTVTITIPTYNEDRLLAVNIRRLQSFVRAELCCSWIIVIADNGSTDNTITVARSLSKSLQGVSVVHLPRKGRGAALRTAWHQFPCDLVAYMDADLSTGLNALPKLVEALASGQYDLAIGSRLLPSSYTRRCLKREVISRAYNGLVRLAFGTHFSDAQCGFKAITKQAANQLLPLVEDNGWFFDTELLVFAEKLGYRIFDLPVRWTENPDSTVKIWRTAIEDIKGIIRLRRNLARGKYRGFERKSVFGPCSNANTG